MQGKIQQILNHIEGIVLGKPLECKLALTCVLAQGHLLIEDLPGMGKTTLAHTIASTLGLGYQRTQFTSDLLPSDIIGVSIFNQESNTFELHRGAIFNQVVLADEINRASPKTQSALLEAMAERQVSIDGITYDLPEPFFVIATQNPLFHSGTYPLPESQLDRFMMRISLGFPNIAAERNILRNANQAISHHTDDTALITHQELLLIQQQIKKIHAADDVLDYIIALCRATRAANNTEHQINCNPLSPRAAKALLSAAKAWAYIDNRDYVLPDDIQATFIAVTSHRIESKLNTDLDNQHYLCQQIIDSIDVLNPLK